MTALASKHAAASAPEPAGWRRMADAPKDKWILVQVRCRIEGEEVVLAVAAKWIPEHGSFCGLPQAGSMAPFYPPLWPHAWMPQPAMDPAR